MLAVLLLICACAAWWWRHWRLMRLTANVPMLPGALPFVGHAHKFFGNGKRLWGFYDNLQKQTMNEGGILKIWVGPSLVFAVTDPKLAHTFLQTFEDKVYVYKFGKSWVGEGLLTAEVPKWKRNRKLLNPTFNQHLLEEFLVVFNEQALIIMDRLSVEVGNGEFDAYPYLETNFLEIICRTALGLSKTDTSNICNEEYGHAAAAFLKTITVRFRNIWLHSSILYNWTKTKKKEDELVTVLKQMCKDVLNKRKADEKRNIQGNNNIPEDEKKTRLPFKAFLDQLLDLKEKGLLTDEEINDEVNTMIMGGSDTTARTMLFIIILLGSNQEVQNRVYNEIQEVLGGSPRDIVKEDLSKFVYMEAVIKESLRVFPIAPMVARKVAKSTKIGDIFLPSDSSILVFISALHRNPCWGDDADRFRPDRWLDGSITEKLSSFAPFSIGRRGCIGKNYAMMSMKTFLAHVLSRYRVVRNKSLVKCKCDGMLKPIKGNLVSIELR